ncbi:MAG: hypothetical protein FWC38_03485 [Proteobacteria bacterium]|nr:hypothetical protein [Pseudomonadota bacterium]MCL2307291.1 hypothetical protein [Pseudomonadota bacterium]
MKKWVVLFSVFLLGCAPDATEKTGKVAILKEVAIFFPAENIKLDFCVYGLWGKDRKQEQEIKIVSPNEAHVEARLFVPDLGELFEEQPVLEEENTFINRWKLKLEKGVIFQEYPAADREKDVLLKPPVVVGNTWGIPRLFVNHQAEIRANGVCTIQALGKEKILGKERAVVTVGCLMSDRVYGREYKIKSMHKMAENLGVIFEGFDHEDAGLLNIELCEDSCASCGKEEQGRGGSGKDKSG